VRVLCDVRQSHPTIHLHISNNSIRFFCCCAEIDQQRIDRWCRATGVKDYFETSAKMTWNIRPSLLRVAQLAAAVHDARKGIRVAPAAAATLPWP
jgi:hypothetical protein